MKFKFNDVEVVTSDPAYDLIWGGYIKPRFILSDEEQAEEVEKALELIRMFLYEAQKKGVLDFC